MYIYRDELPIQEVFFKLYLFKTTFSLCPVEDQQCNNLTAGPIIKEFWKCYILHLPLTDLKCSLLIFQRRSLMVKNNCISKIQMKDLCSCLKENIYECSIAYEYLINIISP